MRERERDRKRDIKREREKEREGERVLYHCTESYNINHWIKLIDMTMSIQPFVNDLLTTVINE